MIKAWPESGVIKKEKDIYIRMIQCGESISFEAWYEDGSQPGGNCLFVLDNQGHIYRYSYISREFGFDLTNDRSLKVIL